MNAQDLKNSILQLAIQGKLVEQREEEGTAKELLEKIEAEKKQLIKEKVIKRQKNLPEVTEEEIDFEIPQSWEWTRLEAITYSIGNKSNQIKQSEMLQEGRYPVVSQSMNRIEGYSNEENKLLMIKPLSVIVFGDHSKTLKLIDFDFIIGADGTKIMVPISIDPKYFYYVLNYNVINMRDRGYSRHFQFLKERLIPLPPLEEQKRIVAKIEELMPYVDKYDVVYSEVEELNKKFPEDMQKSILQYAIQGKLVEQREEDGTAEDLYKQIQEEKKKLIKEGKIKKIKALPEITEDEIPFDIPENWKWVRLGDVFQIINGDRGKNYPSKDKLTNKGIPFISALNIEDHTISEEKLLYMNEEQYEKLGSGKLIKGDLVLCIRGSLGKNGRYPFERGAIASSLVILRSYVEHETYYSFITKYLNTGLFSSEVMKYNNGTAQPNLGARDLAKFIIPLPPLNEQGRIVEKINEIMPFCNQLVK